MLRCILIPYSQVVKGLWKQFLMGHLRALYSHTKTIEQHPESLIELYSPSCSTKKQSMTPYFNSETIEQHPESLYSPSCSTREQSMTIYFSSETIEK